MDDEDQRKWMDMHCRACIKTEGKCVTPDGMLMGETGCWTGNGDKKVFCPYHIWSASRFKLMQYFSHHGISNSEENPER